jgi:hypothetical protein
VRRLFGTKYTALMAATLKRESRGQAARQTSSCIPTTRRRQRTATTSMAGMRRESCTTTGEGKIGDQLMVRGNRAIGDHRANGTALRLFVAVGNKPGSDTRIHHYVGQFAVDPEEPYLTRIAPGTDGIPRNVFVFRLHPVGPVVIESDPQTSPIEGAEQAACILTVAVDAVPLEVAATERSQVEKVVSGPVVQSEAQLTGRFQEYLEGRPESVAVQDYPGWVDDALQ